MRQPAQRDIPRAGVKVWFIETRPHFLLLSVALIMLGTATAWFEGHFDVLYFWLGATGLILLHISVNTLNDYYDHKSGIDLRTQRTPFSGGSGLLPDQVLRPEMVYRFSIVCFLLAVPIGIYFSISRGWQLLPLLVVGAMSVLFYTQHMTRWGIGEFFAGLGLGMLPVLGMYYVQTGEYTLEGIVASVPSGILTHNLLFLNEFPDAEADLTGGRRHMVIRLGKRRAAYLYTLTTLLVYLWIVGAVATRIMPVPALLGLLTIPQGIKAVKGAWGYKDRGKLVPGMAANVMVVLLTQGLVALGYFIAAILK
ncbi:MAG: prenyltransferase [Chloroflexi bacterium]|nr:prenyltransferase [Chloroflexota bacterium]